MQRRHVMTRSEQFVYNLSKAACLTLWTYPNPIGKDSGKELCDVLVVCRPDVLIFSVKEIELKTDGDLAVQIERWKRRAVDESVEQIYGAQRRLEMVADVTAADGKTGVQLGPLGERKVQRIAVAIGAGGTVPLQSLDAGKGFLHVLDEDSLYLLLSELDTITDFTEYLLGREALITANAGGGIVASEPDLLAYFLLHEHSFSPLINAKHHLTLLVGLWDDFFGSAKYKTKKSTDVDSYVWDNVITQFHDDYLDGGIEFGSELATVDEITRVMARENRMHRRMLGDGFKSFMDRTDVQSRVVMNRNGQAHYVFLKAPHEESREDRVRDLEMRCFIARDEIDKKGLTGKMVGLSTEVYEKGKGFSLDALLLDIPTWGEEQRAIARRLREDTGFFKSPEYRDQKGSEFEP